MATEKLYTKPGILGKTLLYNGKGELVGSGTPGLSGTTVYTDMDGKYIGKTASGPAGGTKFFGSDGKFVAADVPGASGSVKKFVYDAPEEKKNQNQEDNASASGGGIWRRSQKSADASAAGGSAAPEKPAPQASSLLFPQKKTPAAPKPFAKVSTTSDYDIVDGVLLKYRGDAQVAIIPKNVRSIASYAFYEKENLEVVIFPEGLWRIEEEAFCLCWNLVSAVLPESLSYLGDACFLETSIHCLHIPGNVTFIGKSALPLRNLDSIIVSPQNPVYKTMDKSPGLFSKDGKTLYCLPSGLMLDAYFLEQLFPEGIEVFADGAFVDIPEGLKKVVFPQSLRKIGPGAFGNWSGDYEAICLPPNIEYIDEQAFGWMKIKNLYVPRNACLSLHLTRWKNESCCIHRYDEPEPWMKFEVDMTQSTSYQCE